MAHPYSAHREHHVEKERVGHIAKHRASGGRVHEDEAQDRKLIKKMIGEHDHKAEGKKSKHRRDRVARAKGGKVKGKGATHVNVIVGGHQPLAPAMPPPPPMPPAAMAPPPPPPPGGMAGLGGAGGPPGMPMRAKGGSVKSGPGWTESMKTKTPVQPSKAKSVDIKNMNRPKPVTYAKGGKVEAPMGVDKATKLPGGGGGGGGGAGRRAKISKYAFGKPVKEVNGAR